jgi:hypothetical protein
LRQGSRSSAGVVYVAFGPKYKELTVLSILWLRRFGYSGPVRVISDDSYWPEDFLGCEIVRVPNLGNGFATRYYKTRINNFGYDRTLFLDADTLPISDITRIWRKLRSAELCMCRDYHPSVSDLVARSTIGQKRRQPEYQTMSDLGLMDHTFYSSGVILFRRSAATDHFFAVWHEEWSHFRDEDQLALVRAIARTGLRVHTLSSRWNARMKGYGTIAKARVRGVHIVHFRRGDAPLVRSLLDQPAFASCGPKRRGRWLRLAIRRLTMAMAAFLSYKIKRLDSAR